MSFWIDVHTHVNFLKSSPEEVISLAEANNVMKMITIGTEPEDHEVVLNLAKKYGPKIFCSLGVHPHEAQKWNSEVKNWIFKNASSKEVVAIGEIGLDFFYNNSPKDIQITAFEEQLELAAQLGLPVEIHTRDAEPETISSLKKFKGRVNGILHCFSGSAWLAAEAVKLGYNISISGIVTFKKAQDLRDIVKNVPLNRIHIETDAPYLAPMPHRGKENTPAFMIHTAEKVAEIHQIPLEKLMVHCYDNTLNMFPKLF